MADAATRREFFAVKTVAETVKVAGFSYMFSKAGFGAPPEVVYRDGDFVALNHTAGRWDGWGRYTPLGVGLAAVVLLGVGFTHALPSGVAA